MGGNTGKSLKKWYLCKLNELYERNNHYGRRCIHPDKRRMCQQLEGH